MTNEQETRYTCYVCGCELDEAEYTDPYGNTLCEDCFYSDYTYCEDCGEVVSQDSIIPILNHMAEPDRYVCEHCAEQDYYRCDDCGDYYTRDGVYTDPQGNCVCHYCFEHNDWTECEDCGRLVPYENSYSGADDCTYCEDCIDEHQGSENLHDYGYKPRPEFLRCGIDAENARYYGVELETDDGDDPGELADDLADYTDDIYCKTDGSLNDGVEIVTHPATLEYHLTCMGWDEITDIASKHGFRSHDTHTCGLHIHVGLAQMREDTPDKLVALVDALWPQLVQFSRRDESRLDQWAHKPDAGISSADDTDTMHDKAAKTRGKGRYQAVNRCPSSTVEFRLFRGTLKTSSIYAALQCVDLMCDYCETHSIQECHNATWGDFAATSMYRAFNEYCESRGIE